MQYAQCTNYLRSEAIGACFSISQCCVEVHDGSIFIFMHVQCTIWFLSAHTCDVHTCDLAPITTYVSSDDAQAGHIRAHDCVNTVTAIMTMAKESSLLKKTEMEHSRHYTVIHHSSG